MKFFFLFIFISVSCSAQYWAQQGMGLTNNMGYAIAVDNAGNTYTTGYFSSTISFNGTTLTSTGPIDMFLVKTANDGIIQWAIKAGGNNVTQGLSVAIDGTGKIVVTGYFFGTATFGSHTLTAFGQKDVFIARYDQSGNCLWAIDCGGTLEETGNKISFDNSGNILITGEFSSSNFQIGSHSLSSPSNTLDVFTAKLDSAGNCLWAKSGTSPHIDRGTQITSDASGNVYVAGEFSDTIVFDQTHNNIMYNALFVIKYDQLGTEQWFRYMGSGNTVKFKGLQINAAGELIALGNFTSSLIYFGYQIQTTLANNYTNSYFLSKISTTGDLLWAVSAGSDNPISSECLTILPNQQIVVGGTFQCRLSQFADQYGQGVFCSLGYNDCFIAVHSQAGTWIYSKSYGGNKNDYLYGLDGDNSNNICVAGGFSSYLVFPVTYLHFTGYDGLQYISGQNYCSDPEYSSFVKYTGNSNTDVYLGKSIDVNREPLDFFYRGGFACIRDFIPMCINNCDDTASSCGTGYLQVNTFNNSFLPIDYTYLWNNGETNSTISVFQSGYYSVKVIRDDGCWIDEDTIYAQVNPVPSQPAISDSKGINFHLVNTLEINLCSPDSVLLSGDIVPGYTFEWQGFPPNTDPVAIFSTGDYILTVRNQFGCSSVNSVRVIISDPLDSIKPALICFEDTDHNDTVTICANDIVHMYAIDSISNPNFLTQCIPDELVINWFINNSSVNYSPTTNCFSIINNLTNFPSNGWYHIDAHIVRQNNCASDFHDLSKDIYVIINPVPPTNISLSLTGNTYICPGDSTTMHAAGGDTYSWSNGSQADSATFILPGFYHVQGYRDSTNSFGCTTQMIDVLNFQILSDPLPHLTVIPASALICPNDSVQLSCDGSGTFVWQGPNGLIPSNASSIYVATPGLYYCIRTDLYCTLNSPTLEVYQYNTPLLISTGLNVICNNEPTILQVIVGQGSSVVWLPPLSGTGSTQTVTSPGTYMCVVVSCNIVSPLSLTIPGSDPTASILPSGPTSICDGDSVKLSSQFPANSYLWTPPGILSTEIYATQSGRYYLTVTDSSQCTETDSIDIVITPNTLTAPFSPDSTICEGHDINLVASGSSTIHWLDANYSPLGTGFIYNTGHIHQNTTYYLYSDSASCKSAYGTTNIFMENCDDITIPNIITTNNDGLNDYFPRLPEGELLTIKIYNRWGQKVFDQMETSEAWTGKNDSGEELSEGTYYYVLSVHFLSGTIKKFHGWVFVEHPD